MRSWAWLVGIIGVLAAGVAEAGAPGSRARLFRVGSCGSDGQQCQWECNAPDPRTLPKCGGGARCAIDATDVFVAHLVVEIDDAACTSEAGGSHVKMALRGRRANGSEFTIPDRTFDFCGLDFACGGCDMTLCPEGGVTCPRGRIFLCDNTEEETVRVNESDLASLATWLGSPSGAEPGQLLPPEMEADLLAAFPDATGRPIVVSAEEIENERRDHTADGSPSVRGYCIKAWFTRSSYVVDLPNLPSVTSPASVASIGCVGPCGDTRPDPAEGCDDGNTNRLDGCDAQCRALCVAPREDCRPATLPLRSRLVLRTGSRDEEDRLRWGWASATSTPLADFGDPATRDDYALCVYDESGETPKALLAAVAGAGDQCGTPPCWRSFGARGFEYADHVASPHGVRRLVLASRADGTKLTLRGSGPNLLAPDRFLPLPLRVQLEREDGACWEATYGASQVRRNDARWFEAVAAP
jgi:cysteine-rich repeat protein